MLSVVSLRNAHKNIFLSLDAYGYPDDLYKEILEHIEINYAQLITMKLDEFNKLVLELAYKKLSARTHGSVRDAVNCIQGNELDVLKKHHEILMSLYFRLANFVT